MTPCTVELAGRPVVISESRCPWKKNHGIFYLVGDRGWDVAEIVISKGLTPSKQIETVIHEMLHALFYFLDEDVVDHAGGELTEALERLELI